MMQEAPFAEQVLPIALRRLVRFTVDSGETVGEEALLFDAPGIEEVASACAAIVLTREGEARAKTLLAAGARYLFLGEAALRDSECVARLAEAYPGRIGIFAPVRRQRVTWTLETESNADFRTLTPSIAAPTWEILLADGRESGVVLPWWLQAMRERGASQFLVQADLRDDSDLNILAELVEMVGERLWIAPLGPNHLPYVEWVKYGQCCQLALPDDDYRRKEELFAEFLSPPSDDAT
ncbi:hypothetical protein [Hydrogenophilus thermoluteolus]|nr:hypothetical protein [Hydrogenophilus thermoluteolus]